MISTRDLNTCCRVTYGHPAVRLLLGDSLHPGGLRLSTELAGLLGIGPSSTVLDAGSGLGATAVHLAQTIGCHVTGVTLEDDGVAAGCEIAARRGVEDRVRFMQGDLLFFDPGREQFDFIVIECVLSILPGKDTALRRLGGVLRPGGRIGLTDVTVSGPLPRELQGPLAAVGCVGGALSLEGYASLLEEEGFVVEHRQDRRDVSASFLGSIERKVLMAGIASKLGNLPIQNGVLTEARRLLALVQGLVAQGVLGYGLLVARKAE